MKKQATKTSEITQGEALANAVRVSITAILDSVSQSPLTATRIAELMKLIALQKELAADELRTITVQWVDTWESQPLNEE